MKADKIRQASDLEFLPDSRPVVYEAKNGDGSLYYGLVYEPYALGIGDIPNIPHPEVFTEPPRIVWEKTMRPATWQGIDHGVLSQSGHVSKRSERIMKARNYTALFPDGFPSPKPPPQPEEAVILRRKAGQLRELASRGMHPKKYNREADRLEAEADAL